MCVCDIVDEDDAVGIAIVHVTDGPVALVPAGVPNAQERVLVLESVGAVLNADGRGDIGAGRPRHDPLDEGALPHGLLAQHHHCLSPKFTFEFVGRRLLHSKFIIYWRPTCRNRRTGSS